jgi:hypothetical protein
MVEIGQFVQIPPQGPKARPRVGVVVDVQHDRRAIPRLIKVYVRTQHQVVGVPPTAVKTINCPSARREGDTLVTGRGLVISLKTGYPV